MTEVEVRDIAQILEPLAMAINSFANSLKEQKSEQTTRILKESSVEYVVTRETPNLQSPISNLIISSEEILWLTNLTHESAS